MAVLEQEQYNLVIEIGKKAVDNIKAGNIDEFYRLSEEAWLKFPEPRSSWNQEYNFSKMAFKHCLNNANYPKAKIWLDRMIDNNNTLHLFEYEVQNYEAIYHFETGDYQTAFDKWKYVVKNAGKRYFENEKPEYLAFYKNPEKYIK